MFSINGFLTLLMSLNLFVFRVLVARKESSLQSWRRWLDKDLSSRPYRWLRPDFVPPSPYLIRPPSGVLVQPALVDAHFRKAWMPFFRREGRDLVTPEAFLEFVGSYLEQASLSSPVLTGEDLHATALAKEGWMDGVGMSSRLYRSPGM